jgi:hypothetical protein
MAFLLSPLLQPWGFEFHVDLPALACELAGLYAFQAGTPCLALVFFELAFFAKQGYVIGLAAIIVYLSLTSRLDRAMRLAGIYVVTVAAIIVVLRTWYPYYLLNTFYALSPIYDPGATVYFFAALVVHHLPVSALAVFHLLRRGFKRSVLELFWIFALCHDLVAASRWGSNTYYFLPTLAASTMLAGLELSVLIEESETLPKVLQVGVGALIAFCLLAQLWSPRDRGARLLEALGFDGAYRPLVCCDSRLPFDVKAMKSLASVHGPVLTDIPELELIHASPEIEDPEFMVLRAMTLKGQFDEGNLLADVKKQRFVMLALDEQLLDRNWRGISFFSPRLRKAIEDNYVLAAALGPPFLMTRRGARHAGN